MALRDLVAKLKIVLDRNAAKGAEAEVTGGFDRMSAAAKRVGAAIAAAFAVKKIVDFGKDAIKTAIEAEKPWAKLAQTVRAAGGDVENFEQRVKAAARAMQDVTTVGDEDFAVALDRLIVLTGDTEASLDRMGLVADVAAGMFEGKLGPAAELVAKAMNGNVAALRRVGIQATDSGDALRILAERNMGQAEAHAKTFAGQTQRLANEWGDFKEAIGNALIEAGGGTSILETVTAVVKSMAGWVETNSATLVNFAKVGVSTATTATRVFWNVLKGTGEFISDVLLLSFSGITRGLASIIEGYATATIAAAKFLGLIGADKTAERLDAHTARMRAQAQELRNWADAARETARASNASNESAAFTRSVRERPGLSSVTSPAGPQVGGVSAKAERDRSPRLAAIGGVTMPIMPAADLGSSREPPLWAQMIGASEDWKEANEDMIATAYDAARTIQGAFAEAFSAIATEGQGLDEGFKAIFGGLGEAGLEFLKTWAQRKVQFNVGESIEKTAMGAAALFLDPPAAAAFFQSAATHAAAAIAWGALAGAGSAAQGAISGSGRGGSAGRYSGRSELASGTAHAQSPPQQMQSLPEIHIHVDGVDPSNPKHQKLIGQTVEKWGYRGGKLVVHPRGGG